MKPSKLGSVFLLALAAVLSLSLSSLTTNSSESSDQQLDSLAQDRAKHLARLREQIKGNGRRAADSVFKNIKTMKGMPAGRLLAIMDIGYSQSLGVSCGHCHNTERWESDEKPQKQIAREMSLMMTKTTSLIKEIKGLKSESPAVNCTTCHRGAVKPALDLGTK
ncbi:MAG: photosynthetic reaction center cytochrome c subunit [Cyclobacteriaceae bacterium]|nr:photosynthetic reaction center cytochrome c subunit [Cyclobacteriaceae bacterium]